MIDKILKFFNLQRYGIKTFPRPVRSPYKNAVALAARPSAWKDGHLDILVEHDEAFPLIALPNPRRRSWLHDSWLTEVQ
jgi:hypothetical protein